MIRIDGCNANDNNFLRGILERSKQNDDTMEPHDAMPQNPEKGEILFCARCK